MPIPTVRREIEFGSLVAIELEEVDWVRRLDIVYRKTKPFTTAVSRFLELLHQNPQTFSSSIEQKQLAGSVAAVEPVILPIIHSSLAR